MLGRYSKAFWWKRLSEISDWVSVAGRLPKRCDSGEEDVFAQWIGWQNRTTTVLSAAQRDALKEITEVWPSSAELRWIRAGVVLRETSEWKRAASLRARCVQKALELNLSEGVVARFFGRGGLWHELMGDPLHPGKAAWPRARSCEYLACFCCGAIKNTCPWVDEQERHLDSCRHYREPEGRLRRFQTQVQRQTVREINRRRKYLESHGTVLGLTFTCEVVCEVEGIILDSTWGSDRELYVLSLIHI